MKRYRTADEALAYEALTMGRPVEVVAAYEHEASGVLFLIYDCQPLEVDEAMYERRFATYVNGLPKMSGIVDSGFGAPPWSALA